MNRRSFLTGLASALAAPVIVRSTSLMQVRGIVMAPEPAYWLGADGLYFGDLIHNITPVDSPFLRLISSQVEPLRGWEYWRDWPADPLTRVT